MRTGKIRYKNSSPSTGTITHGFAGELKQIFTNSSEFALRFSMKYLALNAIKSSFPVVLTGTFSLTFPSSEFEVKPFPKRLQIDPCL